MSLATRLAPELRARTPPEVLVLLDALQAEMVRLTARVAELELRLQQNSGNSSRPPSSDAPADIAQRPKRRPSGRKPGGQLNHASTVRPLLPEDQADHLEVLKPTHCRHCRRALTGNDPWPHRHQVTELPPLKPSVTEYQCHVLACPHCHQRTKAELPLGVPTGAFGPRLQAATALLTGRYRLSKREAADALGDLLGVELSVGSVCTLEQAVSAAVAVPVAKARAFVQAQKIVHGDETRWREGNGPQKSWLWLAVTTWVTVFLIRSSRGAAVAKDLLGASFAGVLVSDRYSAYHWVPDDRRQFCWAHLTRDFQGLVDLGGAAGRIGQRLLDHKDQMFAWWHRVRDGTMSRYAFRMEMSDLQAAVGDLLRAGAACAQPKAEGLCHELLKRETCLWTFVRRTGVEPTNNAAEQAGRPAVLWRKGSFGTQSTAGSEFVARMLTVTATCRRQGRSVLEYLTAACTAALRGEAAPSLLPSAAPRAAAA